MDFSLIVVGEINNVGWLLIGWMIIKIVNNFYFFYILVFSFFFLIIYYK